jgi:hypothetical protein
MFIMSGMPHFLDVVRLPMRISLCAIKLTAKCLGRVINYKMQIFPFAQVFPLPLFFNVRH